MSYDPKDPHKCLREWWDETYTKNEIHCRLVGHQWDFSEDHMGRPQRYCFRCCTREKLNQHKTQWEGVQVWEPAK